MQPQTSIVSVINANGVKNLAAGFKEKTWKELDKIDGALENLKAADHELFKQKFKEQYNKEYTGQ